MEVDFPNLKDQGCFIAAARVMSIVNRMDITTFLTTFLESRNRMDKNIAELWIAVAFTLGGPDDVACYARCAKDDPPDVELLLIDRANLTLRLERVEVAQCTKYSRDVFEVIRKKLLKRYHEKTDIVVLVEEPVRLFIGELGEFIRDNNRQGLSVYIIGARESPGTLKFIPCREDRQPETGESGITIWDVKVDHASEGYLGFDGVVCELPQNANIRDARPLFVKNITLTR